MRVRVVIMAVVALVAVALVTLGVVVAEHRVTTHPIGTSPATTTPPAPGTSVPPDIAPELTRLAAHLPSGSISVAARNLDTDAGFNYGSHGDHTSASIFKLDILEALMLQQQASRVPLSEGLSSDATVMMVTSDNDSATRLYLQVGGAAGVREANRILGLRCTEPNEEYWGLSLTCAEDQVQLAYQLKSTSSPLTQASKDFILNLMQNVAPTQRWGVPIVADPGTVYAVKNGWLDLEHGRDWVVNSVGIVTYKGQTLLIATLCKNNHTMESGVSLNEKLAELAAQSVTVQ